MEIRPATVDDIERIREVADAAWWDTYPGVLDADRIRTALDSLYDPDFLERVLTEHEDVLFVVAEREERVIGFASARQTFADEAEIHTLFVHPDHQREGVGTALFEGVVASARDADAERIRAGVLSGNHEARGFFEAHGFERVETVQTEVGGDPHPEDVLECSVDSV